MIHARPRRIPSLIFVFSLILLNSCLHSKTTAPAFALDKKITIVYGHALLIINGQINENLYRYNLLDTQPKDQKYYDNPAIREGTITKNEIKYLVTGDEYSFSILPTEVLSIQIRSADGKDVELIVGSDGGRKEERYTVSGTDTWGFFRVFQNRREHKK